MTDKELLIFLDKDKNLFFNKLFEKYRDKIMGLAYKFTYNERDAKDITQETFIKIYFNIDRFRRESSLITWIYRIAINEAKYFVYKAKKNKNISIDNDNLVNKNNLLDDIINKELFENLRKIIFKIPDKYRDVLILKEYENYSYEEISKSLNISIGTVESRLFRARKYLKKLLK